MAASLTTDRMVRNDESFRTLALARGNDVNKNKRLAALEKLKEAAMVAAAGSVAGAAKARAELSEENGAGIVIPPTTLPPASYYKDVRNHASIATTMLTAARHTVGFEPGLAGQELSEAEMFAFSDKFFKWQFELDNYWPFIDMRASQTMALWFHSGNENLINDDVSSFLLSFRGLNDNVLQVWRTSLTNMVKGASDYVTQQGGNVRSFSFQMDTLDTSGKKDFLQSLTFGRSAQSDPPNGKHDSMLTSGVVYLVNSDEIIAAADDFAQNGIEIVGVREYQAYVNNM